MHIWSFALEVPLDDLEKWYLTPNRSKEGSFRNYCKNHRQKFWIALILVYLRPVYDFFNNLISIG